MTSGAGMWPSAIAANAAEMEMMLIMLSLGQRFPKSGVMTDRSKQRAKHTKDETLRGGKQVEGTWVMKFPGYRHLVIGYRIPADALDGAGGELKTSCHSKIQAGVQNSRPMEVTIPNPSNLGVYQLLLFLQQPLPKLVSSTPPPDLHQDTADPITPYLIPTFAVDMDKESNPASIFSLSPRFVTGRMHSSPYADMGAIYIVDPSSLSFLLTSFDVDTSTKSPYRPASTIWPKHRNHGWRRCHTRKPTEARHKQS